MTNQQHVTDDDIERAWGRARLAVLEAIAKPSTPSARLDLAEAYAWLTSVNQPHGGRTSSS